MCGTTIDRELFCDFFEVELAAGFQHAYHFIERIPPSGHVMNDPGIKDRVISRIGGVNFFCVADKKPEALGRESRQALSCQPHHLRIEIKGVYLSGLEPLKDDFRSNAPAAADL